MIEKEIFIGSYNKLSRARVHIEELKNKSSSFLQKYRKVIIRDYYDAGYRSLAIVGEEKLPSDFAPIIGDVIHNLRGALDQAVWELVHPYLTPESNTKRVQYPFAKNEEGFLSKLDERYISLIPEDLINIIRQSKPYEENGNSLLINLDKLGILDRHKVEIGLNVGPEVTLDDLADVDPTLKGRVSGGGKVYLNIRWPIPDLNRKGKKAFGIPSDGTETGFPTSIVFDLSEPLAGPIIDILEDMYYEVSKLIDALKNSRKSI